MRHVLPLPALLTGWSAARDNMGAMDQRIPYTAALGLLPCLMHTVCLYRERTTIKHTDG